MAGDISLVYEFLRNPTYRITPQEKFHKVASIHAVKDVTVMKLRDSVIDRASVNCQLRFQRKFLLALIERLEHATVRVASSDETLP